MPNITELREQRNAKAREIKTLLDENPGDKWTAEHNDKFDALEREISDLDAAIDRHQKVLDLTAARLAEEEVQNAAGRAGLSGSRGAEGERTYAAIFQDWMRGGDRALSADDWTIVRNTMSTTTDAEGGYLVPDTTVASVLEALKAFGGMRSVANIITTGTGNTMNYPTSDGTAEVGEIVDQNASASDADVSFGVLSLDVYKYSSKVVTVPIELLQDSNVDIEAFVRKRLVSRLGRIMNSHFTTGTGIGQPKGIITAAATGKTGATGQTTTVILDDLIDLIHSIDPAYREGGACRFMFNDSTLKALRKLKDTVGRPIWMPGDAEGITGGIPASIFNYPYTINQSMASMAASAKSIAFGDFSFYTIRDVMAMTFYRFTDSAYAKKGQVGFLAFLRSGGNFMDVGGAVKLYVNSAT